MMRSRPKKSNRKRDSANKGRNINTFGQSPYPKSMKKKSRTDPCNNQSIHLRSSMLNQPIVESKSSKDSLTIAK